MRKSLWIILAVMVVAVCAPNAQADTTFDLNLPGIGNLIPVESFTIDQFNDLSVTCKVDSFTPAIFDATVTLTTFATGSFDTFDSSFSTTIPITSFVITDSFFTSIQHFGSLENPMENDTLHFATGTLVSNVPEPASLMLLGSGLLSLAGIRRRRSDC